IASPRGDAFPDTRLSGSVSRPRASVRAEVLSAAALDAREPARVVQRWSSSWRTREQGLCTGRHDRRQHAPAQGGAQGCAQQAVARELPIERELANGLAGAVGSRARELGGKRLSY